jgi:hypothetical protein
MDLSTATIEDMVTELERRGIAVARFVSHVRVLPYLSFRAGGNDDSHGLGFAVS